MTKTIRRPKVAIYARYSSDHQREASIEDQIRLCQERVEQENWTIAESYADYATSGASLIRPGIQALLSDAREGKFDIIIAEALDRLSRDQEDIAGIYKRMEFAGIKIITLSEGEVSNLHIGLKGTMNALFLKDLADKTRRGLRGRVEKGKSGGGNSYGYDVVKSLDANGNPIRGERRINKTEATIIIRIMEEFVAGHSPLSIAERLNKEDVPCPRGRGWGQSTINGNQTRGTGILNNELYIGKLIWNRLKYVKDPDTGKRLSRLNPEADWIIHAVPDLQIINQSLWNKVKTRQQSLKRKRTTSENHNRHFRNYRRPKFLLSGLVKCGTCGGTYTVMAKNYFGCSTRHNKRTCDNDLYIRHDRLEATVLGGLKHHLIQPEGFDAFCKAFAKEVNRTRIQQNASRGSLQSERAKIEREIAKLITALKEGGPAKALIQEIQKLEERQENIEATLKQNTAPTPLLHLNMAKLYADKLRDLYVALNAEDCRQEAITILRSLIDHVVLIPVGTKLQVRVEGDLAGLLSFTARDKKSLILQEDKALQLELVAGVGFEPTTFRL